MNGPFVAIAVATAGGKLISACRRSFTPRGKGLVGYPVD